MPPAAVCWPAVAPIFRGDAIAKYALNQSVPEHLTEVPDPGGSGETVFKMDVLNTDLIAGESPRAQLLTPKLFVPGTPLWVKGGFWLPASFPTEGINWLQLYEAPYGPPYNGSAPVSLKVADGLSLQWQRNGTYAFDIPFEKTVAKERWIEYLYRLEYAGAGFVELWLDGKQVTFDFAAYNPNKEAPTTKLVMATEDASNNSGENEAIVQNYRAKDTFEEVIVYHKGLVIGRTRASVGG